VEDDEITYGELARWLDEKIRHDLAVADTRKLTKEAMFKRQLLGTCLDHLQSGIDSDQAVSRLILRLLGDLYLADPEAGADTTAHAGASAG
jgi:hypothetical protein